MSDIEKIATDRYRIRAHNQLITLSAQDLRDLYDWCLLHMRELEQEAKDAAKVREYNAQMDARDRIIAESIDKPWLPLHDGE